MSNSLLAQVFIAETPLAFERVVVSRTYRSSTASSEELTAKHKGILQVLWRMQTVLGRAVSASELAKAMGSTPASAGGRLSSVRKSLDGLPELCNYQLLIRAPKANQPKSYVLTLRNRCADNIKYNPVTWHALQQMAGVEPTSETRITQPLKSQKEPALDRAFN